MQLGLTNTEQPESASTVEAQEGIRIISVKVIKKACLDRFNALPVSSAESYPDVLRVF